MNIAKLNLQIGSAQREFNYRKGTADEATIVQALKSGAYELDLLRRGPELMAVYERTLEASRPPLIVDTAADIGAAAVFFAHRFAKAQVIALERDPAKFQLLKANTDGFNVECIAAAVGPDSNSDAAVPCITFDDIYSKMPAGQPFIVKLDIEAGDLFSAEAEWLARTPVLIAALSDHLLHATAHTRAFVERAAGWNRDFVYLHDSIFSISREPRLMAQAA